MLYNTVPTLCSEELQVGGGGEGGAEAAAAGAGGGREEWAQAPAGHSHQGESIHYLGINLFIQLEFRNDFLGIRIWIMKRIRIQTQ